MEDLQNALQRILSDPAQMNQIMALAGSLGIGPQQEGSGSPASSEVEESSPPPAGPDPALLQLASRLGSLQGPEEQVFQALRPIMSQQGQGKVDRAIRAARLSRVAGMLLKQGPDHV